MTGPSTRPHRVPRATPQRRFGGRAANLLITKASTKREDRSHPRCERRWRPHPCRRPLPGPWNRPLQRQSAPKTQRAATVGRPYETCTITVVGAAFRRRSLFFPWRGHSCPCSRGADTPVRDRCRPAPSPRGADTPVREQCHPAPGRVPSPRGAHTPRLRSLPKTGGQECPPHN